MRFQIKYIVVVVVVSTLYFIFLIIILIMILIKKNEILRGILIQISFLIKIHKNKNESLNT